MTARVLGPTGSGRRRRFLFAPILMVALAAVFLVSGAQAVHDDDLFELGPEQAADILGDGNAANGPDWAQIFNADGSVADLFGGTAAAFFGDDSSLKGLTDASTFSGAGGSNKNNDPISTTDCATHVPPLTGSACDTWHWDSGNVPAKDDLVNSYAYAVIPTSGQHANDLIIYSGLERLDESGDSHVDFEFLQNSVNVVDGALSGEDAVPCNDPGPDATPCEFSGIRTIGDVILSMDFVQGGGIGEVTVREWNGHEYVLEGVAGGEGCNSDAQDPSNDDTICAFNNGALIDGGPWPNLDKTGATIEELLPNAFTEIGVNVSELLGFTPCISTVMGKTRSSSSFTAELKDFTVPKSFPICSAAITIGTDDVNEVGDPHTFTVNVSKKIGNTSVAVPDGTDVDVTLTDANGAVNTISKNTCDTDANDPDTGQPGVGTVAGACTVTFTSNTAGTVTGHAEADVDLDGELTHVETDGTGSNSSDTVKRFVDARISIDPDDVNSIGENHTFTVKVEQDDGLAANATGGDAASGFGPAPATTTPTVTLTNSDGATNSISSNTCSSGLSSTGTCTVTFTSNTAGTVTGHAAATFSVGGVSLSRETDGTGDNSNDAVKQFVAGSLVWIKHDNNGQLQGGATFQVCRTHNLNTSTDPDTFDDQNPDVCVSVVDDTDGVVGDGLDRDPAAGKFKLLGLRLGRYTVKETAAPAGFVPDPDTVTVELTLESPDGSISTAFVNERPVLKITGFGYTNEATGSPKSGVVSGVATYSVSLKNYGGAAATLSNSSLAVNATGVGGGTVTCGAANTAVPFSVALTGTVNANGGTLSPTPVACTYSNVADGAVITATLTVNYTTNTLERAASGSPATISFTVQAD